ncbi:siroheme decarboxylase subunit beta [Methanolobus halotolerans]|uniref:siroheme decarboxylase n=1 Tax=Methanolobus halotolerans TaxID=2052935 RepID=A0A4E0PWV1_9EURY|nr:siroheme decarboxylase subunit beta [Methanolobus halotolerans]TGC10595.1 Lrp/AsnC family transcriptional regulator [Methanolobus halotolerans]
MDETEEKIIKLTQNGIPLTPSPFRDIASSLGLTEEDVVTRIEAMQDKGIIRRFGASIGHRDIGIIANAMCIWNVPDGQVEDVGSTMASFEEVTHCYERPRCPGWEYNLFTMVHSYTREDCEEVAARISQATGIMDYRLLFSEREFKKTGIRL